MEDSESEDGEDAVVEMETGDLEKAWRRCWDEVTALLARLTSAVVSAAFSIRLFHSLIYLFAVCDCLSS
jgi:hypothetical protein